MVINYNQGQLTQSVNLLLTFEKPIQDELSARQNLAAWKVVKLTCVPGADTTGKAIVSYSGRLAFGVSQDDNGNVIIPSAITEMKLGESVDLDWKDGTPVWGTRTSGDTGNLITATNMTPNRQDISVGTLQKVGTIDNYSPSFMWKVGKQMTAEADFHPMLRAYVNTGFLENEFITADIRSPLIKQWNLAALSPATNWLFRELPQGNYAITPLTSLSMVKEILPKEVEDLNLSFACTLNWQANVPHQVVTAVFAYISSTLVAKGLRYSEEQNDKSRHRKCIVGKKEATCETLSAMLKCTFVEALEKESATINGKALTPPDFDLYWTITDEYGMNVRGNEEEEIISEGSSAWYLLK
ncbi:hypothetical protein B0H14DRAFT_3532415 [Mycena olivaceomarginata]|nr:hypothetical protein B0H14DRAFT_3532415 [Mycena olivaceomarginata]